MGSTRCRECPVPPVRLPEGLYVRGSQRESSADSPSLPWRVMGRNPDFWWEIVVDRIDAEPDVFELRCSRCGAIDRASSPHDLLRLIGFGAHLHDTDPAGNINPPDR